MATQPTYGYAWATQLVNNGPTGGPNKITDTPQGYQDQGFTWDKAVPFELLNGWRNNIGLWLDYFQEVDSELVAEDANLQAQIDAISLGDLTGTSSNTWTIGTGNDDIEKCFNVGNSDEGSAAGKLCWRESPEFQTVNPDTEETIIPWMWWGTDNSYSLYDYPLRPLTTDDLEILQTNYDEGIIDEARFDQLSGYVIYDSDEISGLALTEIERYHSGVETFTVDVRYLGNTTESVAKATAEAQVSGQQEGDNLNVIYYKAQYTGQGNWTKVTSKNKIKTYTYTSGSWV